MTLTVAQARAELEAAVRAVHPSMGVYTGTVPDRVPESGPGWIRPYVCLWISNSAGDPTMESLDSLAVTGTVRLRVQTQLVAADTANVYWLADQITLVLTNLRVGAHVVKPDAMQHETAYVLTDTGVTPSRPYLPLMWTLETQ